MPCRVYLVRHGEVDASWRGRIYGALDVPLSVEGCEHSRRVAAQLVSAGLSAVISSGLRRTEHTAALLREPHGQPRMDDSEFRELERGDWAGRHIEELTAGSPGAWDAWLAAPASMRPPGGECLTDLRQRILPRLHHWTRLYSGRSIALVTHGWVIRVLICEVLGIHLDRAARLDVRTGDILRVLWPTEGDLVSAVLEGFAVTPSGSTE